LQEIRDKIWTHPRQLNCAIRDLGKVNREERFTDWLDGLPFPLASILWAYHASKDDPRHSYDHLDHFFEALAEFMATVFLSVFVTDDELFSSERKNISETLLKNNLSIEKSSFGTWVKIAERLSKVARTMYNSNKKRSDKARCELMFQTTDADILQPLFSSKLVGVLQETNNLRNDWRGHGGIAGNRIAYERSNKLQSYLAIVRECFGDMWNKYQLILPINMKLSEGIFSVTTRRVVGPRTPFESIELQTTEPIETEYLHLIDLKERRALKLLPFVRVMASPKSAQNACYFYNRRQTDGLRFVSYHFEPEAEVVKSFEDTYEAIKLILGDEQVAE